MNNDMSDMLQNLSKMMNNQEMPENIKNILSSMNMNNNNSNNNGNNCTNNCSNNKVNNSSSDCGNNSGSNSRTNCSNNNINNNTTSNNTNTNNNSFGDIDINTILKIQRIMSSINNDKQNDSRTNLLKSLKPYLKESRKNKVDQYIQLMKMGKVFEIMNPLGGDEKHV